MYSLFEVFLGLTDYLKRFIPNDSRLTKKNSDFIWTNHCEKAFDNLKKKD